MRLITGDTHPDHATICAFRAGNKTLVTGCFVKLLQLAQELKLIKVGQVTVSIDGTKVESRLIVGARVSQVPNDKQELVPTFDAIAPGVGPVGAVLTDNGFYSEAAVLKVEQTAYNFKRLHRLGAGRKLALAG